MNNTYSATYLINKTYMKNEVITVKNVRTSPATLVSENNALIKSP